MWDLKDMIPKKNTKEKRKHTHTQKVKTQDRNELTYKTERDPQTLKTNLRLSKGKDVGGRINYKFGINKHTLQYIKQLINKDLVNSTGTSTQYSIITCVGKDSEKEWIYVYKWLNHFCCTPLTNTTL